MRITGGWSSALKIQPFDRLNVLSVGITLAIGAAIYAYCFLTPAAEPAQASQHLMHYLGFIHFAVGYHFFFSSPFVRPKITSGNPDFFLRLIGCIALSTLFYRYETLLPVFQVKRSEQMISERRKESEVHVSELRVLSMVEAMYLGGCEQGSKRPDRVVRVRVLEQELNHRRNDEADDQEDIEVVASRF